MDAITTKFIGLKEFRQNISLLSRTVRSKGTRFIVLNRNQPVFDVRPLIGEDVTLERLANDVAKAREDARAGRVYTFNKLKQDLGLQSNF